MDENTIRQRIKEIQDEIEKVSTPETFVLNKDIVRLACDLNDVRAKCFHRYEDENLTCSVCGHRAPVILYSTSCPQCNVLKKKLEDANVDFEENNDIDIMTNKGLMSAPALEFPSGKILNFSEAIAWLGGRK